MHNHQSSLKTLKNALGQVEAVIKMTEEDRYCIDISTQISAAIALLKKAQSEILSNHIHSCVKESIEQGNVEDKLEEINTLLKKLV
ncbi:metal-sensing transcriptional repressor [Acholeplasma equirhinis]|uniref:metal-sensing transcriptional repressor n=1 Tax=Acholeplasma equirhinis TaxID=555393 RepID=UPI00197ADEB4|nr:metal-sensing transcriptional repressor [Acholeplasma equirhinis]MBN3490219.1 metal-sensing transcriptional repressor [Acholeplasma equirhinis]